MSFANDIICLPIKPMNGHNETNNRIKRNQNPCINSLIQVRIKIWKENTCIFYKQKGYKVTNYDGRISIGNEDDPNCLIQFMEIHVRLK